MGYTNYYYRPEVIPEGTMDAIVIDFAKVVKELEKDAVVLRGWDGDGDPLVSSEKISFNGDGELAHETCELSRVYGRDFVQKNKEGLVFQFCKTVEKPYDIAVKALLVIAQHYLGEQFQASCDGTAIDWASAKNFVKSTCGYGLDFKPHH